jgi:hypothetical protein
VWSTVRLATTTWVCNCGSPARDVRWAKAAAATPSVSTWRTPSRPRRARTASDWNAETASATARSWAPPIRSATSGSANAQASDTDLGAENVRSNPGTRPARRIPATNPSPLPGWAPANSAAKSTPSTVPSKPRRAAAAPSQYPGRSPPGEAPSATKSR